ncbi:NAD-dependent SIR2 family protein deacetylase [Friedmanniella endophytica]|uniref:protein acetyllysine N-acetyltransferase n=1 Tax=Microlunatus kandeliicorticis TaxID=1759536 RepID=A0A7W3IQE0_9ACTN|nr:Sir2 family NAD-dependent protein deacetylase [Microlunatus kandeliicorticis]MBA8793316.1 NAD-dependent SIR2 family protein deacetylase [Microlunatus kandeliicorticis]
MTVPASRPVGLRTTGPRAWSAPGSAARFSARALGPDWRAIDPADLDRVRAMLDGRRWVCLTGAGMSTDSGIPDYRGPDSPQASPMLYAEFFGSVENRRRYWARSFLGWSRMGLAEPNAGHRALAALGALADPWAGVTGVITQNVDGLHEAAGSDPVVALHGRIADVICLDCGTVRSRAEVQGRLAALNPGYATERPVGHAELRPDGDAVVGDWQDFVLADCPVCGGRLKPDVVFFGETVPRARVDAAYALVDDADLLLVAGSSLTVMSGLRFVRHQVRHGREVVIVNRGATRGDDLATLKIDGGTTELFTALLES